MAVYVAAIMLALLSGSCQKEGPETIYPPPGGTTPLPPVTGTSGTYLRANAGGDHTVMISPDFFKLTGSGSYLGLGFPTLRWHWAALSGPSNPLIEFADSGYTKVRNLVPGTYIFELTLSFLPDYIARDTVSVEIRRLAPVLSNELILNSSNWFCDWGFCNLVITNVLNFVPPQTAFRVYLKRHFFSDWLLVDNYFQTDDHWISNSPEYYYYLFGDTLAISVLGNNFTDIAQVKLVF